MPFARRLPPAAIAAALWLCAGGLSAQGAPAASPLRLTGQVFSELALQPGDSPGGEAQFNVTRAYFGAIGTFEHGITTRLTLDVYRPDSAAALVYRLKHAYVQLRPGTAPLSLRLGMVPTAWIEWQDALWGYRMQGAQPLDRAGFITSADLGASADFATRGQRLEGTLAVLNGEGFANPPDGRFADAEGRVSLRLLATDDASRTGGVRLAGFAHVGRFPNGAARDRFLGQLSYRSRRLAAGGSYAAVHVDDPDLDNANVRLWSAFAARALGDTPAALIARLDRYETVDHAIGDVFTRAMAGVAWRLGGNVRLLADGERTWYLGDRSITPDAPRRRALFQTEFAF